ncbi:MAG: VWA domain-containing protein, partial [Pseudomonadales bacterium]|nr:VWA domain-containing protein [Pseudomonadales bacterium]
ETLKEEGIEAVAKALAEAIYNKDYKVEHSTKFYEGMSQYTVKVLQTSDVVAALFPLKGDDVDALKVIDAITHNEFFQSIFSTVIEKAAPSVGKAVFKGGFRKKAAQFNVASKAASLTWGIGTKLLPMMWDSCTTSKKLSIGIVNGKISQYQAPRVDLWIEDLTTGKPVYWYNNMGESLSASGDTMTVIQGRKYRIHLKSTQAGILDYSLDNNKSDAVHKGYPRSPVKVNGLFIRRTTVENETQILAHKQLCARQALQDGNTMVYGLNQFTTLAGFSCVEGGVGSGDAQLFSPPFNQTQGFVQYANNVNVNYATTSYREGMFFSSWQELTSSDVTKKLGFGGEVSDTFEFSEDKLTKSLYIQIEGFNDESEQSFDIRVVNNANALLKVSNANPTVNTAVSFSLTTVFDSVKEIVWKFGESVVSVVENLAAAISQMFNTVGDVLVSATLKDGTGSEITTVSTTVNVKPLVCLEGQIIENGKCVDIATLANGEANIALYGDVKKEMISTVKIDDGRTALLVDDVTAIYAAFGLDTRGKGLQDYVNTHINAVISMLKTNGAAVNTLVNKPTRNAQGLAHNVVLDADFDSVVKSPADLRKLLLEYFNNKVLSTQLLNVVSTPSTKLRVTLSFWESNGNVFVWASVFPIDKSETVLQLYGDLNSTAAVTTAIKLQSQNNQQDFTQQAANLSGVDILWNVDNSGSMQEEQTNLANGAANFFSKLKATGIDYRLAVNTTDGRQCSLRKLTDGTNRFISSSTLNGENEWSILSRPGTSGSGTETAFYCVRELLEGVGGLAQDKAEFDRPNAKNLVVFVTDEPEIETYQNSKPTGSPSSYVARTFNDYKNFFVSSGATFFSIIEPNSTIVREDFTV